MKLELQFNNADKEKYENFLHAQLKFHREDDCEYPGSTLEIVHHPALGYFVSLKIGSATCDFVDVQVNWFED